MSDQIPYFLEGLFTITGGIAWILFIAYLAGVVSFKLGARLKHYHNR